MEDESDLAEEFDERATWLDTRDVKDNFVDLVELALYQVTPSLPVPPPLGLPSTGDHTGTHTSDQR